LEARLATIPTPDWVAAVTARGGSVAEAIEPAPVAALPAAETHREILVATLARALRRAGGADVDAPGVRVLHAEHLGDQALLVWTRPGGDGALRAQGARFAGAGAGWAVAARAESAPYGRGGEYGATAGLLATLRPAVVPAAREPEPLPDWREAAARGETLIAIGLLDELRFRGRPAADHFVERARLNERLADETPAEYAQARGARYTEAIQDLRDAVAAGQYPGEPRFAEREVARLQGKIAALGGR
jgi:hypothetical protein